MATENLKNVDGKWGFYSGCSCSAANWRDISLPNNSKALLIKKFGTFIGPVTGINYRVTPGQISIDIDKRDAEVWVKDGTAVEYGPEHAAKRGRLTRYEPTKQT